MNFADFAKYQQMLQVLGQQSPMMPQAGGLLGPMMADKGDRRREDFIQQDGPHTNEFKGNYESIGVERQPEGSPNYIDPRSMMDANRLLEEWIKSGRQGPVPSFKSPHKGLNEYEHWRLRGEVPTSMMPLTDGIFGPMMAAKGDVDGEWESYGSLGTRKGGDIFNPADKEGDLDLEGYEKARNEEGNEARGTDHKDPNDAKGWRRQLWIKKQRPMS